MRSRRSRGARFVPLLLALGAACNAIVGIDDPVIVEPGEGCDADADCPSNARCLATRSGNGICLGGSDALCNDEGDCPGIAICSNGECRNDCSADPSSCLSDQACGADGICRGTDPGHDPVGSGGSSGSGGSGGGKAGKGGASGKGGSAGRGGNAATGGSDNAGGAGAGASGGTSSSHGGAGAAGEAGAGQGGGGGGNDDECDAEGHVTCVGQASPARVQCEGGQLLAFDPCQDGELCDNASDPSGSCVTVPAACVGRVPGEGFCEGSVRTICGPDLVTVSEETCESSVLCMLGTDGECGVCVNEQHRCTGDLLEVCNAEHDGFDPVQTCTNDPCNPDAGACTSYACLEAGDLRCNGDDLERCNDERSDYVLHEACAAGLCDSVALECDACPSGQTRCPDGTHRAECSEDGQAEVTDPCPGPRPYCVGAGQCVQCRGTDDCTPQSGCYDARCNSGNGTCEQLPKDVGATCSRGGNAGFCDSNHECVECVQSSQCVSTNECRTGSCNGQGACAYPPRGVNANCGSGDFCDGNGTCVDCNNASQCGADTQCVHPRCSGNSCSLSYETPGVTCSSMGGRACDGAGTCVPCYGSGQAQCGSTEVCRSQACVSALHSLGWEASISTTTGLVADVLYLKRLPVLANSATLKAFGVVGTAGGSLARMALYSDNAGGPGPTGAALAEAVIGLAAGARETNASPATVTLNANAQYWIGIKLNTANTLRAGAGTPAGEQFGDGYTNAFPTFTGINLPGSFNTELAIYIRVQDTN